MPCNMIGWSRSCTKVEHGRLGRLLQIVTPAPALQLSVQGCHEVAGYAQVPDFQVQLLAAHLVVLDRVQGEGPWRPAVRVEAEGRPVDAVHRRDGARAEARLVVPAMKPVGARLVDDGGAHANVVRVRDAVQGHGLEGLFRVGAVAVVPAQLEGARRRVEGDHCRGIVGGAHVFAHHVVADPGPREARGGRGRVAAAAAAAEG
mmetsp:Transcript_23255/g.68548  ORF Transcript_23255/g.68548 Transcript_23255/m.68548 type:complete len:203 (-) Transcript_23255:848-1456(-)